MNARQRREAILKQLNEHRTVYTNALCEEYGVSAMTLRRDFARLEAEGLITTIRGGAALNQGNAVLHSLELRQRRQPEEKRKIAAHCAAFVQEGESVFIDNGSTGACIAECLAKRSNLTLLTASLDAAEILSRSEGNRLIIVPGVYAPALRGASGQMTADFMERFHVDWLFLGANGLDTDYGLTSPDYTDAETKRVLIRQARRTVVATDSTKLGQSYFERIARLEEITRIVTDSNAASELLETMRQRTDVDSVG